MKISPARNAAFDCLLRVETERAFTSVLLPLFEETLTPVDRGLFHELVLGSLRRRIWLDRVIDELSNGKKLDVEVRVAIRLGLYQLHFLNKIPQYSAINESVNLVQRAKKTSAKSFVNAILRRASREIPNLIFSDEIDRLSVEHSHPRWLVEKWNAQLGLVETEKLLQANNTTPKLNFRFIADAGEKYKSLITNALPSDSVDGCYILDDGGKQIFELIGQGKIYIQDAASQLTAQTVKVPVGGLFLDVCAAPGSKTGLIAPRNSDAALIAAGDIHTHRVKFLQENCQRQGVNVAVVQYDAEISLPFADETFDAVLVDAPCSGTGTIRHNPELRYFVRLDAFAELQAKQLSILQNASKLLKKGGVIIYSTCSIEREENEEVCEMFLNRSPHFKKIAPDVPQRLVTDDGFARTWPQRDDMDGFFIAAFVKEK